MEDPNNAANATLTSLYEKTWVVVDTEKALDKGTVIQSLWKFLSFLMSEINACMCEALNHIFS